MAALLLPACERAEPEGGAPSAAASAVDIPAHRERRATPGELAVHNLEEGLKQVERALRKNPKSMQQREALVGVLLQRASFLGKVSDLERALQAGEQAVALEPKSARAYRLRAKVYGAVHRFDDALADLDQAEGLGASVNDTRSARGSVLMGLGRYDEAFELLHQHRTKFETPSSLALEAAVLGRMGKHREADRLFGEALASYRGTSPFTIAWIYFEQGSMWDRAGDRGRARKLYEKALEKLPLYAHAAGHLAAMLPPREAEPLLRRVIPVADDPEYLGMLAGVLERLRPGSGGTMLEKAKAGYERLMKALPLAFADHAGWFYLDALEDVDRAVEVAELNLEARKVPEAFELAIAAELAAGERDEACRTADRALAIRYPSAGVKARAADAFEACGKKERAAELKQELAELEPGRGIH